MHRVHSLKLAHMNKTIYRFTESNAFTASLPSGAAFTNTLALMHSLSLTQTISIWNSMLSIFFLSFEPITSRRLLSTTLLHSCCVLVLLQLLHQCYYSFISIFYDFLALLYPRAHAFCHCYSFICTVLCTVSLSALGSSFTYFSEELSFYA